MSKKTATLYDIIHSELDMMGFNEFVNDGGWTFHNPEFSYMTKIARFDDDIKQIVDNMFFRHERLLDEQADHHFKKAFLNRFLDKSINSQTIEGFSNKVVYTFLLHDEFINHVYDINSFLTNEQTGEQVGDSENLTKAKNRNESTSKNEGTSDNRNARTELPQSGVTIDVDNTELDYANEFNLSKNKDGSVNENTSTGENENETVGKTKTNTTNRQYTMDNLLKIRGLLESVFVEFEKNCFLQVF